MLKQLHQQQWSSVQAVHHWLAWYNDAEPEAGQRTRAAWLDHDRQQEQEQVEAGL